MVYDRDLKWFVRISWLLLAANVGMGGVAAWRHEWIGSAACVIWALNVWFWQGMIKTSQQTRNMTRLTDAAVLKVLAGDEQD
jgi:hypothetical protein